MPVCPRCGKLVSDKKYERHIRRHEKGGRHPVVSNDHRADWPLWSRVPPPSAEPREERHKAHNLLLKMTAWGVAAMLSSGLVGVMIAAYIPDSIRPMLYPIVFILLLLGGWSVILLKRITNV